METDECRLNVLKIPKQVGADDVVERRPERQLLRIALNKGECAPWHGAGAPALIERNRQKVPGYRPPSSRMFCPIRKAACREHRKAATSPHLYARPVQWAVREDGRVEVWPSPDRTYTVQARLRDGRDPETIRRFDLDTGGFSVSHGDRLSSLLTIENRDGSTQKAITTSAALSVTDANIVTEGRLPGNDKGSWLVSARRTYYDLVASRVTDSDFPRFADVQAKVRYDLAPGRSLSFFGLRSRQAALLKLDDRSARGEFQDDTRNDLASVRLDQTIGSSAQAHW